MRKRVGLLGPGNMGRPIAERLARDDAISLTVWGRSASSTAGLDGLGARIAETPRALAAASDVVLSLLPDLPPLQELLDGPDGLLEGGAFTLVVGSTSSPEAVRGLGAALAPRIRVVDAPVSGGVEGARDGTLAVLVGGETADVAAVLPVLELLGRPVHLGPLGAGQVAKACNQLIVAATVLALGEATVLAERSGIDLGRLLEVLGGGYAGSRVLDTRARRFVEKDYSVAGPARFMVKDLGFALDAARATGTGLRLAPELHDVFRELTEAGFGDLDISVTQAFTAQATP